LVEAAQAATEQDGRLGLSQLAVWDADRNPQRNQQHRRKNNHTVYSEAIHVNEYLKGNVPGVVEG
jgi:hypothetical protein